MSIPGPLLVAQIVEILALLIETDNTATLILVHHQQQQHPTPLLCPPLQVVRDYHPGDIGGRSGVGGRRGVGGRGGVEVVGGSGSGFFCIKPYHCNLILR